ncbi:hypothetical protein H6504_03525 [Candidatus Woesearchaeota archaeon]|nr:hypothetical protein [Candidatus Woesearchaeota archaeon]
MNKRGESSTMVPEQVVNAAIAAVLVLVVLSVIIAFVWNLFDVRDTSEKNFDRLIEKINQLSAANGEYTVYPSVPFTIQEDYSVIAFNPGQPTVEFNAPWYKIWTSTDEVERPEECRLRVSACICLYKDTDVVKCHTLSQTTYFGATTLDVGLITTVALPFSSDDSMMLALEQDGYSSRLQDEYAQIFFPSAVDWGLTKKDVDWNAQLLYMDMVNSGEHKYIMITPAKNTTELKNKRKETMDYEKAYRLEQEIYDIAAGAQNEENMLLLYSKCYELFGVHPEVYPTEICDNLVCQDLQSDEKGNCEIENHCICLPFYGEEYCDNSANRFCYDTGCSDIEISGADCGY